MEESYKTRKEREERERRFQKKKRLENARRAYLEFINDPKPFNLGVQYNMIDQLSEELAQYLDMVDVRRVLTEMLEFVYDPSMRPEDPVDYFAKLTKDRKKDKRELNKARRHLYQLMWKEYDIKDEIAKLRTLLHLTNPREYKPDGTERNEQEKIEFDKASEQNLVEISVQMFRAESLRSLMEHKDQKIPGVFGTYSTPAPEPMAVSGKEIMAERAALVEKSKKAKGLEKEGQEGGKGKKGKRAAGRKKSGGKSRSKSKSRSRSRSKSVKRSKTSKRSQSTKPK
uniref:Uncharacterized protein n=1 Tax=Lygus hesperus TaxID=30085 RepID=A0A0A9YES0_LYGHE